jgi:hypothetical protein
MTEYSLTRRRLLRASGVGLYDILRAVNGAVLAGLSGVGYLLRRRLRERGDDGRA